MNNLNSCLVEGNMARDPQTRTTPNGTAVCTFPIASSRFYKKDGALEKEVSFFDVECWSKLAENCANMGRKGRGCRVVGRLKQERWNGGDGKQHSKVVLVADHVEFRSDSKKQAETEEETVAEEDAEAIPF